MKNFIDKIQDWIANWIDYENRSKKIRALVCLLYFLFILGIIASIVIIIGLIYPPLILGIVVLLFIFFIYIMIYDSIE